MGNQGSAKQQAARAVATKRRVKKATAQVKADREKAQEAAKNKEVTDASTWKKGRPTEEFKLQVPSGNVCLVRPVSLQTFLQRGMIPNALLPLVQGAVNEGRRIEPKDTVAAVDDPDVIAEMIELQDAVISEVVIEPVVHLAPKWTIEDFQADKCRQEDVGRIAEAKKDPKRLYADEVDLEDKAFIFQFAVGGVGDLERFREQQAAHVSDVALVTADGETS